MAGDAIVTRLEKNQSTQKSRPTMLFRPTLAQPRHLKQAAILLNVVMHKGDSHATGMAGNAIVTLLKRHQFTPRSRQTMSFQPTLDQPRHLNQTAILPNAAMHIQELPATGMAGHATVILLKKNHPNFLVLQRKWWWLIFGQALFQNLKVSMQRIWRDVLTTLSQPSSTCFNIKKA